MTAQSSSDKGCIFADYARAADHVRIVMGNQSNEQCSGSGNAKVSSHMPCQSKAPLEGGTPHCLHKICKVQVSGLCRMPSAAVCHPFLVEMAMSLL